jgi:hypothetical protein
VDDAHAALAQALDEPVGPDRARTGLGVGRHGSTVGHVTKTPS